MFRWAPDPLFRTSYRFRGAGQNLLWLFFSHILFVVILCPLDNWANAAQWGEKLYWYLWWFMRDKMCPFKHTFRPRLYLTIYWKATKFQPGNKKKTNPHTHTQPFIFRWINKLPLCKYFNPFVCVAIAAAAAAHLCLYG